MKKAAIDFSKQTGRIKPMHGVNNGPIPEGKFRGVNNYESFKALQIPYIRVHDASFFSAYGAEHTVDVDAIFRDRNADENDPESYDFALTDYYMLSNYSVGSKVVYRLGSRIEHEDPKYQTVPYEDSDKFARVCEHIIRHLCYGWKDGLKLDIPYWEIWAEPDLAAANSGSNPCWQAPYEDFFELYAVTAKHLKACFPELKIGGPGLASAFAGYEPFEKLIAYIAENRLPLDFLSWHLYHTEAKEYAKQAFELRKALDELGYGHTELMMDEWNYVSQWCGEEHRKCLHAMKTEIGAAFDASVMLTMQKAPVDVLLYYDARGYCEFNGIWDPLTFEELKAYRSFMNFSRLYQLGAEVFSESDDPDVYVGAAKDGSKLGAELAYYRFEQCEDTDLEISLSGLPQECEITVYLTDKENDSKAVRHDRVAVSATKLYMHLKPDSVVYLDINKI